jgi:thiosulfate dehydrogenase [quinone] large subunit
MRAGGRASYWLVVLRLYLGWSWLAAGWDKARDPAWESGKAVAGFLQGALKAAPYGWYKALITSTFLPNAKLFAFLVTWGEVLVGVAFLVGLFTGLAAIGGILMNLSFLLAGSVSTNPAYIIIQLVLIFSGAGMVWGVDGVLQRKGYRIPAVLTGTGVRRPGVTWVTAGVLAVLAILAFLPAPGLKLPEFSNPASQLSRTLAFAALFYALKAWMDGRRLEGGAS